MLLLRRGVFCLSPSCCGRNGGDNEGCYGTESRYPRRDISPVNPQSQVALIARDHRRLPSVLIRKSSFGCIRMSLRVGRNQATEVCDWQVGNGAAWQPAIHSAVSEAGNDASACTPPSVGRGAKGSGTVVPALFRHRTDVRFGRISRQSTVSDFRVVQCWAWQHCSPILKGGCAMRMVLQVRNWRSSTAPTTLNTEQGVSGALRERLYHRFLDGEITVTRNAEANKLPWRVYRRDL